MNDVLLHYDGAGKDLIDAIRSDDKPETWPAFKSLTLDDYAYTMERDMETELQEVVRYKINIEM